MSSVAQLRLTRIRASSPWPAARTSASRRSPTRWSAARSRSSPTSRRRRAARSGRVAGGGGLAARAGRSARRAAPARRAHRADAAPRRGRARRRRRLPDGRQRRAGNRPWRPFHRQHLLKGRTAPGRDRRQQDRPHRPRARRCESLQAADDLEYRESIFPISARKGTGVEELLDHLVSLLPQGPFYFDPSQRSDQSESVVLAELVREQMLPHA